MPVTRARFGCRAARPWWAELDPEDFPDLPPIPTYALEARHRQSEGASLGSVEAVPGWVRAAVVADHPSAVRHSEAADQQRALGKNGSAEFAEGGKV